MVWNQNMSIEDFYLFNFSLRFFFLLFFFFFLLFIIYYHLSLSGTSFLFCNNTPNSYYLLVHVFTFFISL